MLLKLNQIEEAESILLKEYKDYKMENISAYKNIINLLIEICVLNENSVERKKYEDELELICNH